MTNLGKQKVWTGAPGCEEMPANQMESAMLNQQETGGMGLKCRRTARPAPAPRTEGHSAMVNVSKPRTDPFPSKRTTQHPASSCAEEHTPTDKVSKRGGPFGEKSCCIATLVQVLVPIIVLLSGVQRGLAHSFHASGVCNYTNYTATGAAKGVIKSSFDADVNDGKVRLKLDFGQDHYVEWTFDGERAVYLVDDANVAGARAAAMLDENEFPVCAMPLLRTVWLGLCSEHYFNNSNNHALLVPWCEWGMRGMLSFEWDIQFSQVSLKVPQKIIYTASSRLWQREIGLRIMKDAHNGKFPYRDGFVGGVFQMRDDQQIGGIRFPRAFRVVRFRTGKGEGVPLECTDVVVLNISESTTGEYGPEILRPTDLSDMRSATPEMPLFGISYTISNLSDILAKDDPKRVAMIAAKKPIYEGWRRSLMHRGEMPRRASAASAIRVVVILLLVVISAIWALIYLRGRRHKPTEMA